MFLAATTFKDLISVCEALGLRERRTKRCLIYEGNVNGKYCKIVMHLHSEGRDIATGTFHEYVKQLGFTNESEFSKFLKSI